MAPNNRKVEPGITIRPTKQEDFDEIIPLLKRSLILATMALVAASCARQEQTQVGERVMDQEKKSAGQSVPSLAPPKELDDEWSRWLSGEWETSAESDLPGFPCWVRGTGRMKAELGVGGQFLVVTRQGGVDQLSDDYVQHLRRDKHTPEEEIEKLRQMRFAEVDYRTIDPRTGAIVAYLFDSWRCVATGIGTCDGNKEIIEWKWSAGGQGTSIRTTERISHDKFIITEKYTLSDGGSMEDRVQMVRAK